MAITICDVNKHKDLKVIVQRCEGRYRSIRKPFIKTVTPKRERYFFALQCTAYLMERITYVSSFSHATRFCFIKKNISSQNS